MSDLPEAKHLVDEPGSALGEFLRSSHLDQPSAEQLQALDAAMGPLLSAPAVAGGVAATGSVVKIVIAVAVAVGSGGLYLANREELPAPPPPIVAEVQAVAPPPPVAAPEPEPVQEQVAAAPAEPVRPVRKPPPPIAEVAAPEDELVLLQRAVDSMRAGDSVKALAAAQVHLKQHPDSAMAQEREVVAIEALVALQRGDEAKARAAEFRRRWPTSTHQLRVDELVGP